MHANVFSCHCVSFSAVAKKNKNIRPTLQEQEGAKSKLFNILGASAEPLTSGEPDMLEMQALGEADWLRCASAASEVPACWFDGRGAGHLQPVWSTTLMQLLLPVPTADGPHA